VEDDLGDVHAGEYAGADLPCNVTGGRARRRVDELARQAGISVRSVERDAEFTSFAEAAFPALRRTAYLMVGDWHLAEDVVQAALTGMHRQWHRIELSYGPAAYARGAVVNAAISELRRPHRRERLVDQPPERPLADAAAATVVEGLDRRVADALRALPPRQRAVVVLRYVEDLDVVRTADLLGVSEGTVKSQAARGLATLRRQLTPAPTATQGAAP
jgi:RNA polymerase sigma-70 factor (sigma-E family)